MVVNGVLILRGRRVMSSCEGMCVVARELMMTWLVLDVVDVRPGC